MKNNDKDRDFDEILENIAEAVSESKTELPTSEDDPFDFYVKRVQFSAFSKGDQFKKRFVKGYHVIQKNLE